MSRSSRFITLTKELNRLKKQFLPKINPPGIYYSDRQLALTIAYGVFVHAEIEAYLEDRVKQVATDAKIDWDSHGKASRTLLSLLAFSGEKMELPPDTLSPIKGSKKVLLEKIKLDKKIELAVNCFMKTIKQNHGLKESNILALLLPIGIDSSDLDLSLLVQLNAFGEQRGLVVHSSATSYRTKQPPDPVDELNKINQITQGLLRIDELINALIK
ncbi:HEPN domain-containing protein [Chamaesiphon sp. VAR_48_metabat_403]|uniref:HEPN domain-containing protein n=1 Tax=Chamaesiphon sp. VAR_48_metabat_403 TaxID=2964700 RepID=UPI00286DA419|nr:HEPN domain-containing protein [Chamaesiphon sp. VAR_48_metabat_403]